MQNQRLRPSPHPPAARCLEPGATPPHVGPRRQPCLRRWLSPQQEAPCPGSPTVTDVSAPEARLSWKRQQRWNAAGRGPGPGGGGLQVLSVPARVGGAPTRRGPSSSKTRPNSGRETQGHAEGQACRVELLILGSICSCPLWGRGRGQQGPQRRWGREAARRDAVGADTDVVLLSSPAAPLTLLQPMGFGGSRASGPALPL